MLALLCFGAFIVMMIGKRSGLDGVSRVFFCVLAATMLISYYFFCFEYPFTCTMNIRYCAPLIVLFAMGLGLLLQRFGGSTTGERALRIGVCATVGAFAVMTCVVYAQIALPVSA